MLRSLLSPPPRWLFFDAGYTLVNEDAAQAARREQLAALFTARGILVTPNEIEQAFYEAAAEFESWLIARVVRRFAAHRVEPAIILGQLHFRKELESPYADAEPVLSQLAERYKLGVIANQTAGTQDRLEKWGLARHISLCLASTEEGLSKPDPAIFKLALQRAGCEPAEAVMIGDRLDNDIAPAKALGWKTVRVLQGFNRVQQPRHAGEIPDHTVETLSELLPLFGLATSSRNE